MTRTAVAAATIAALVLAAGCGGSGHTSTPPNRTLTERHDVSQLRQAFNTASGEPRLIVLVSPT
jgi:hypothetical protein